MKFKNTIVGLLLLISCTLFAQEKGAIGLTFSSFGSNDVINSARESLLGGPSYSGDGFYSLGVSYIHPVKKWLSIESGLEYVQHSITTRSGVNLGIEDIYSTSEMSLINIPVTARINFLKYFFVNGGLFLGFDAGGSNPIDDQSGIGLVGGIGAKYDFGKVGIFVNAYSKSHAMVSFGSGSDEYRWKVLESGIRLGVSYNF